MVKDRVLKVKWQLLLEPRCSKYINHAIFHEMKHEDNATKSARDMKQEVKKSMEKLDKHVAQKHEHRRKKVQEDNWSLEDYLRFEMESME